MAKKHTQPENESATVAVAESGKTPPDELQPFRHSAFTEPVTELEKLLSQSKRAFLLGAGCSKGAGLPLMDELTQKVLATLPESTTAHAVLSGLVDHFNGARGCTIEDYMSELVDFVSIADRRQLRSATEAKVEIGTRLYPANELLTALAEIKDSIATCISDSQVEIQMHRRFVRTVHGTLESGKSRSSQAVDYFTLNYDTLLEDALSLERISAVDGFNGGVTGWWDADTYLDPGVQARVFKVHGSIDWCLCETDVLPRRIRHGLPVDGQRERVLIWPAATKYRETQRDPYAQIIDFLRKVCRPASGTEVVLTICGYAFGDSHINIEIDRALRESDQRLTIVAFTSEDEPSGLLKEWLGDLSVREQVRVHANRGFFHAGNELRSVEALPWWKFEVLTRLLGGER